MTPMRSGVLQGMVSKPWPQPGLTRDRRAREWAVICEFRERSLVYLRRPAGNWWLTDVGLRLAREMRRNEVS